MQLQMQSSSSIMIREYLSIYSLTSKTACGYSETKTISSSRFPATWSSPETQQLFEATPQNATNSTQLEPSSSAKASGSSSLNGGQIAGISVGLALAVLLLLGSWYLISRRCRRRQHILAANSAGPLSRGVPSDPSMSVVVSEWQTEKVVRHELPGPAHLYQDELHGDLGGTEVHGDSRVAEVSGQPTQV